MVPPTLVNFGTVTEGVSLSDFELLSVDCTLYLLFTLFCMYTDYITLIDAVFTM